MIRNSSRNQFRFAEKAYFWSSPEFGGKIPKFRIKIQANCGEDLFYLELTRPFIPRTLNELLEGTLIISSWWLRTSNKFTREEVKRQPENSEKGQLLSGCGFVQNKSSTAASSWVEDEYELINQSQNTLRRPKTDQSLLWLQKIARSPPDVALELVLSTRWQYRAPNKGTGRYHVIWAFPKKFQEPAPHYATERRPCPSLDAPSSSLPPPVHTRDVTQQFSAEDSIYIIYTTKPLKLKSLNPQLRMFRRNTAPSLILSDFTV